MKKKSTAGKVVIKSLGKRSGNASASTLARVVRDARSKVKVKAGALRIEDTATGSGHISFHISKEKPSKAKTRVAA